MLLPQVFNIPNVQFKNTPKNIKMGEKKNIPKSQGILNFLHKVLEGIW